MAAPNVASDPYILEPTSEHRCSIILLHGRGSHGEGFCAEFLGTKYTPRLRRTRPPGFELGSQDSSQRTLPELFPSVKWVFPSSPSSQTRAFAFGPMPQWFDLESLTDPSLEEERQAEGLKESIQKIHGVLRDEIAVLGDPRRVFLFGISMGCAAGLHALLSFEERIGGFIGSLGWCPFQSSLQSASTKPSVLGTLDAFYNSTLQLGLYPERFKGFAKMDTPLGTPALVGYNTDDDVVMPELSQQLITTMAQLSMPVQAKIYRDMLPRHWIKEPEAIDDIGEFISSFGWV